MDVRQIFNIPNPANKSLQKEENLHSKTVVTHKSIVLPQIMNVQPRLVSTIKVYKPIQPDCVELHTDL